MKKEVEALLDEMGLAYHDYGTYSTDSCDYPVFGARAAKACLLYTSINSFVSLIMASVTM